MGIRYLDNGWIIMKLENRANCSCHEIDTGKHQREYGKVTRQYII